MRYSESYEFLPFQISCMVRGSNIFRCTMYCHYSTSLKSALSIPKISNSHKFLLIKILQYVLMEGPHIIWENVFMVLLPYYSFFLYPNRKTKGLKKQRFLLLLI